MLPKPTILVIEDEELLLQVINKKMQLSGMEPIPVTTGAQGLDYLTSSEKLPDVIWLDYYLKDMTGFDFVVKLHQNKNWAKIPVLIVSNSATKEKISSMMALGVTKYILKADHRLDEIIAMLSDMIIELKEEG